MAWGREARAAHEKDMGSYELFAWRDALSIAMLIDELFGARRARLVFDQFRLEQLLEFEAKNSSLIRDFIQKTESQRPSFLAKICKHEKDENTQIAFVSLALLGVLRAKAVMELRDLFRTELAPGRGNRVTTAGVYDFSVEMHSVYAYAWPSEVFEAMALDDGHEDEDDDD